MKRFTGVRVLTQCLTDSDIGIFIGKGICEEASPYLGNGSYLFFSTVDEYVLSFVVGVAMCTDKRIFVFCEDQYAARNLSELMHMAVAKTQNLFLILFLTGEYGVVPDTPTAFSNINSTHGFLYDLGFIVHDYKRQFKLSKNPINYIRSTWERVRGPLVVLLEIEKGSKQLPVVIFSSKKDIEKTKEFILNEDIVPNVFIPPL